MTGRRRWGEAGVRLTDGQTATIDHHGHLARVQAEQRHAEKLREARMKWAKGMLVPHHITAALNFCNLYGPEVDIACGAKEPDVDMWEAGVLYPSWEQVVALGKLCGRHPIRFMGPPVPPLPIEATSLLHHLPPEAPAPDPIYVYTRAALDAAAAMGVSA